MNGNESRANNSWNISQEPWPSKFEIVSSPYWYMSMLVEIFVVLTNIWIATSFVHYYVFTKRVFQKKRSRRDVNNKMVMIFAIAAILCPFLRYIGTISLLVIGLYPEEEWGCEVAYDVAVFGFAFALCPTYAYLWVRQRAFYGHPSLRNIVGKCVSVFSKISMFLILAFAAVGVGLGIYPKEYEPGPGGCFLIGNEEQGEYRTYIYTVTMVGSQITLFALLLRPLLVHARQQRSFEKSVGRKVTANSVMDPEDTARYSDTRLDQNGSEPVKQSPKHVRSVNESKISVTLNRGDRKRRLTEPSMSDERIDTSFDHLSRARTVVTRLTSGLRRANKTKSLFRLIRRVLILALISIFSDLTIMIINQFVIPDDIPQTYSFVLYDFNILINTSTVVLSFAKWRKMLLSPCAVIK